MLKSHLKICLNLGLMPGQLKQFVGILKSSIGVQEAKSADELLHDVLKDNKGTRS